MRGIADVAGVHLIGIDLGNAADGLARLISARRAGVATAILPILSDPLEHTFALVGQSITSTADNDQRAQHASALKVDQLQVNGRRPSELAAYQKEHIDAAALALRLADTIFIAAPGERDRWTSLIQRPFRRFCLLPIPDTAQSPEVDVRGVTIYAPSTEEPLLALYVMLLRQHRIEPYVISARNPHEPVKTRVVITPEWRPMRARIFAARGHHVVAPNVTRVDECDSRIFGYAPADYRSLSAAVDAARTSGPGSSRFSLSVADATNAIAREKADVVDGPLVSIIIRTYDRPVLLRRAVASVAAQTYKNVEIVVVNNGGTDVSELVTDAAGGCPVKYERMPERLHISAASNVGARAAAGAYIGYLDDDDLIYADHCARTVEALERTGVDAVFTTCLAEYAEMRGDEKTVLGYQVYLDREFSVDDLYVSNLTPIHSIVHKRDVFDRFGYFDEELPVTDDWEFWLRIVSRGATFARIDRVTCEYSWRYDPERGNMTIEHQWDFVHAYRKIVERYAADVRDRPSIHAAQANLLAQQEGRARDAADPGKRASIVIGSMSASLVPVGPVSPVAEGSPKSHAS